MPNAVPYGLLTRAVADAWKQFPNATRIKGLWTPASRCEVMVEVWNGDRATVHGWEPSR